MHILLEQKRDYDKYNIREDFNTYSCWEKYMYLWAEHYLLPIMRKAITKPKV